MSWTSPDKGDTVGNLHPLKGYGPEQDLKLLFLFFFTFYSSYNESNDYISKEVNMGEKEEDRGTLELGINLRIGLIGDYRNEPHLIDWDKVSTKEMRDLTVKLDEIKNLLIKYACRI